MTLFIHLRHPLYKAPEQVLRWDVIKEIFNYYNYYHTVDRLAICTFVKLYMHSTISRPTMYRYNIDGIHEGK